MYKQPVRNLDGLREKERKMRINKNTVTYKIKTTPTFNQTVKINKYLLAWSNRDLQMIECEALKYNHQRTAIQRCKSNVLEKALRKLKLVDLLKNL